MKRLLNTLYVTSENAWLRKDGANLVVEVDGAERGRAPLHMLDGVVTFGRAGASPALMAACAEAGVALSLLDPNGRFLARVEGARTGNVLLRRTQYRWADDPGRTAPVVQAIVAAKSANQRAVVRRGRRDHGPALDAQAAAALAAAERRLTDVGRRALITADVDALRGLEGEAGQVYFGVFPHLVRVSDPAFRFGGRSRRPRFPLRGAVAATPARPDERAPLLPLRSPGPRLPLGAGGARPGPAGGLPARRPPRPGQPGAGPDGGTAPRPRRPRGASLVNRRQLSASDFVVEEAGGVRLTDPARKAVLIAWQERKRDSLRHPFLSETAPLGLVPALQAQLLARRLRGDLDGYPAFFWK